MAYRGLIPKERLEEGFWHPSEATYITQAHAILPEAARGGRAAAG